jgi:hypothetical protein
MPKRRLNRQMISAPGGAATNRYATVITPPNGPGGTVRPVQTPRDRLGPPTPQVREREVDGNLVLFDAATSQALFLNDTASDVWRLLDGELDLAGVVTTLARAYGVEPDAIEPDVEGVVTRLCELRLLPVD